MASSSKRQTTFAKMQREQRVKEKRALKAEKKAAAREAKLMGPIPEADGLVDGDLAGEAVGETEIAEESTETGSETPGGPTLTAA